MDHLEPEAERIAARLAERAIRAQDQLEHREVSDERLYQRGARHAYAAALAHATTPEPINSAAVYDTTCLIIAALDAGTRDPRELLRVALNTPAPSTESRLTWIGLTAFERRHAGRGVDEDLGMRWGRRGDIRISLRRRFAALDSGVLYAYDPLWDEYAVLADPIRGADATAAFHRALSVDPRMEPDDFAHLLPTSADRTRELGMLP